VNTRVQNALVSQAALRGISVSDERFRARTDWTTVNASTLALLLTRRADLETSESLTHALKLMRFVEADLCLSLAKRNAQRVELHRAIAGVR
jgi:hypothetical protein